MLHHDFSEELKEIMKKLFRKDKRRYDILMKKVEEIAKSDEISIEHYKNLRHEFSNLKRVHIDKSFVLLFSYDREKKFITFTNFGHHDDIYER